MKLLTVIGARPQIIKAAAFSRAINTLYKGKVEELILHTGQHYDENMSDVFFDQLGIPKPTFNLNVGSGAHGVQTAKMISGIEEVLEKEKPDALILYGDTNSTLAGAIAASKIHIPVVHIEAGLRSFNKNMPEEINRILCDHSSTILFSPTDSGLENLKKEGFKSNNTPPYSADNPLAVKCGDLMYDNSLHFSENIQGEDAVLSKYGVSKNEDFILVTCHRPQNTDRLSDLSSIMRVLNDISLENNIKIVFPIHPRTKSKLAINVDPEVLRKVEENEQFIIGDPTDFIEMITLEKNCKMVITDSGGVQKEAYFFEKPCVIMRPETEWVEIVQTGSAILTGSDYDKIKNAYAKLNNESYDFPKLFGDGKASEYMINTIVKAFS